MQITAENLIDAMYAYYKSCPTNIDYNATHIKGMHFYDSVVVVEKESRLLPPTDFALNTETEPNESNFGIGAPFLKN